MLGGREGRIPDLAALGDVLLLHQDDGTEWRRWLAAAGVGSRQRRSAPEMYFSDVSVAIDVALYGGGMALASDVTCSQHLRDGTLIRPFATKIATDLSWWVLCEPHRLAHPGVALFVAWIAGLFGIKELPAAPAAS
jgi:LysR family glycine cleavage system transcriptional activator